eukprot:UN23419
MLLSLLIFSVIAIPIALTFDVIDMKNNIDIWEKGVGNFVAIFFLRAIIWETLYRGILQNLFHSKSRAQREEEFLSALQYFVL